MLASIDAQVRTAAVAAHYEALRAIAAGGAPVTVGGVVIPAESSWPREVLAAECVELEFDLFMRDDGVSLNRPHRWAGGGTTGRIKIKWESVAVPESNALVRTATEAVVAREVKSVRISG